MDRRTFIVGAGVGAVGLGTPIAHADEHEEDDDDDGTDGGDGAAAFEPEINVGDFQFSVRTEGEPPDDVRVTTADGTVHEFTEDIPDWADGGYFRAFDDALWFGEGWFGVIEEVSASRDGETVTAQNEDPGDVNVTCTNMEGYEDAYDLRLHYENATKRYDPPAGDGFTFGSPGRELEMIVEMADETEIVLGDRACQPDGDPAVTFDCTSVTVEPEEFVNGPEEFYNPTLHFTDESDQQLGDGEAFEPPATLEGTGEHAGKVVQRLTIWNDSTGAALFSYTNPDADACEPEQEQGAEDGEDEPGADQDGEGDDGTSDEEGDAGGADDGDGTDGDGTDGDGTDGDGTDDGSGGGGQTDDSGDGQSAGTDPDETGTESGGEAGGEEASEQESHAAESDDEDGYEDETAPDDGEAEENESENSSGEGVEQTPLGESESDGPGFGALATLGGIGGVAAYLARRAGMDSAEE